MKRIANTFRDSLKPKWGIPQIKPIVGQTFDVNNDLHLLDARTVEHRDGYITTGSPTSVTHDALTDYNRRHMAPADFEYYYADDPSESGFGY